MSRTTQHIAIVEALALALFVIERKNVIQNNVGLQYAMNAKKWKSAIKSTARYCLFRSADFGGWGKLFINCVVLILNINYIIKSIKKNLVSKKANIFSSLSWFISQNYWPGGELQGKLCGGMPNAKMLLLQAWSTQVLFSLKYALKCCFGLSGVHLKLGKAFICLAILRELESGSQIWPLSISRKS